MRMPPHGFIAVELLIVVATAVTGISATTVALRPTQELAKHRDMQRTEDVATITAAIHTSGISTRDFFPRRAVMIGTSVDSCATGCSAVTTAPACADLRSIMPNGVPKDPMGGTNEKTDYYVLRDADGTITVGACDPEGQAAITVSQ